MKPGQYMKYGCIYGPKGNRIWESVEKGDETQVARKSGLDSGGSPLHRERVGDHSANAGSGLEARNV